MVNEHIGTVFLFDEAEPFGIAKPLNYSIGHSTILLSKYYQNFKLEDAAPREDKALQKKTAPHIEGEAALIAGKVTPFSGKASYLFFLGFFQPTDGVHWAAWCIFIVWVTPYVAGTVCFKGFVTNPGPKVYRTAYSLQPKHLF
jgi:hypothetical protein